MRTQCAYCGDLVAEGEYDAHLRTNHYDELGAIDRRRVGDGPSTPSRQRLVTYAGFGALGVVFLVAYLYLFLGSAGSNSGAAVQPDSASPIHEHGTIAVSYDGTVVDFDDPQYVLRDECFHFHTADSSELWHTHCEDVTIEYALETLGMELTGDSFSVDGETFSEADGDTITVTVDGEPVDAQEYVLDGVGSVEDAAAGAGDHVEVVVETGD